MDISTINQYIRSLKLQREKIDSYQGNFSIGKIWRYRALSSDEIIFR